MNVTVLCVDDRDDAETFDRHFDRDRASRVEDDAHEPRSLQRYGPVVVSARAARAALLRALNDDMAPDVVLIDHMLRGDGREKYEEGGVRLMSWIGAEFAGRGEPLPACALCTARFEPGLAYAFVSCGGVQAIDRTLNWPDQIAAIWQGYDWTVHGDGRWTHKPRPGYPAIPIPPASAALLPYLESDIPNASIAAALGVSKDAVLDRRRTLVQAINTHVPTRLLPEGMPVVVNGRSTSLARIAQDHGHVWVPLAYVKYVSGDF